MPRATILVIVWIISALAITFGIGSLNWPTLSHLSTRGVRTDGVVVALQPQNHYMVDYAYIVSGHTFHGSRTPAAPNPSLDHLSVGQSLTIVYDPLQPAASFPGDPQPALQNETVSVGFAAVFMPSLITLAAYRAIRRHQTPPTAHRVA